MFGNPLSPEPDPLWLKLLNTITQNPGVTRSELLRGLRNTSSVIGDALEGLRVKGLAYPVVYQNPNGGSRGEKWYPGKGDGGEDQSNNQHHLTPSPNPLPPPVEGTNYPPTPDGKLVSSFQGEGGLVKEKGVVIVKQWADSYNQNPQYPEPLPQWMNLIGEMSTPSP